jgi:hypothetical protein
MPKRLEDPIDAETALRRADSFLFTVRFLGRQPMEIMAAMMQGQVLCDAMCTELYMKILAQLERGTPPLEGHNLKFLAGDLSAKSYRRMAKAWRKHHPGVKKLKIPDEFPKNLKWPTKFDDALALSAKAFIDFRYGEKEGVQWWQIGGVADELREIILELKPEWRPSGGPRTALDPKPDLAKTKDNQTVRPVGSAILNQKPPAFHIKVGRVSNPKDRDTD